MKPNKKVDSEKGNNPNSPINPQSYTENIIGDGSVNWIHYLLFTILLLIIAVSVINILNPHFLWGHFEIEDYALHSTFEALGAISAILVAFLPLQALFEKTKPSYIFISVGFLVMGLWDLVHSFFTIGKGFVFTHSMALICGGIFFVFILFPWKSSIAKYKNRLLLIFGLVSIIIAITTTVNHHIIPEMLINGDFTNTANYINLIAGILFVISSVKLLDIYFHEKEIGVLILIFITVSSAVVGITFQYSGAWTDGWWLWHVIRLISFIGLLGYMFWRVHHLNNERNGALQDLKIKHNQLMETEDRFRLVNEATMQGLWDWDVPKNEVYFSPVWKMQVGYNDDELVNDFNNWIKLLHPEDKDRCLKAVDDYLKNPKGKFILEFRFQHKNGHYVWIHNQAASVKDKEENVLRMFGAHTDITAQKEAEKAINREIEFTDSVINSMPGIFYLFDQSGKFLKWNNTLAELSGLSFEEVGRKSPLDFIAQDHREKVGDAIQTAFREGMVLVEANFLVKGQSPVPFLFTVKRIMRDKLPLVVGVGIDITKRKKAESEKEKAMQILNNVLKEVQRSNEELERFAYVASHDLQEPLRMVSSFTQLLEKRYKGQMDDRADRYIHYAVDGANRMQQLINDLLDFSRVSTRGEDFIVFDTNEAINNVKNSLSLRIEESGTIIETGKLPEIKGDKTQIERVFLNLLSNAIKFRNPDKSPVIEINVESEGDKWLFSIKDNGIGIDEKFQEKVFVIFQRLHGGDQYKGTGIGLAICKRIIQRHGGEIWFRSEEGKGTTFFFTINK